MHGPAVVRHFVGVGGASFKKVGGGSIVGGGVGISASIL